MQTHIDISYLTEIDDTVAVSELKAVYDSEGNLTHYTSHFGRIHYNLEYEPTKHYNVAGELIYFRNSDGDWDKVIYSPDTMIITSKLLTDGAYSWDESQVRRWASRTFDYQAERDTAIQLQKSWAELEKGKAKGKESEAWRRGYIWGAAIAVVCITVCNWLATLI